MTVIQLGSTSEYDNYIRSSKYTIVAYTTTWCPYCVAIMPTFESLSRSYNDVQFVNADLNRVSALTSREGITGMPTFIVFRNGSQIQRMGNTSRDGLVSALNSVSSYKL